jgi:hypothetical protein
MNIKRFNQWKINETSIPIEYYHCNDCNSLYPQYDAKMMKCKNCGSKNVNILTEDEYFSKLEETIDDPQELSDIMKNRGEMKRGYIDPNSLTHPNIHTEPSIHFDMTHLNRIDVS